MLTGRTAFKMYRKMRYAVNGGGGTRTLAGNITLTLYDEDHLLLDPDGASRDVTLPAEEGSQGLTYWILNTGTTPGENLVVKSDAPATIATLDQSEWGMYYCDGTTWYQMGGTN